MNIVLKIDEQEFKRELLLAALPEVNKAMQSVAKIAGSKLGSLIYDSIMASPEVQSASGGQLQAELGIPDLMERISIVAGRLSKSPTLLFSPAKISSGQIRSSLTLSYIKGDYEDILGMNEASFNTENGSVLFWLEWLLLNGDKVIIQDYSIGFDLLNNSRTGLGKIMIGGKGRRWSIPTQFAGTQFDNFITRSLDGIDKAIEQILQEGLK